METKESLNTHGVVVTFGKHKGSLLTRVPAGYLRWMANEGPKVPQYELALAEIERRGHKLPECELSGHAIDMASLRVRKTWHQTRRDDEGLYSWLQRMTLEAIEHGERDPEDRDRYFYNGMKLVIIQGEEFPSLKTVMRAKGKRAMDRRKRRSEGDG